ncbi:hypothetical protein DL93DRAFT_2089814 [Clavulina sp. PMI_390]|nr:hypothetical protein DL93DRAFT_2089814 [Clavulina sp. PMI_390]
MSTTVSTGAQAPALGSQHETPRMSLSPQLASTHLPGIPAGLPSSLPRSPWESLSTSPALAAAAGTPSSISEHELDSMSERGSPMGGAALVLSGTGSGMTMTGAGAVAGIMPQLAPEVEVGNVEYKLKLLNPTPERFTRLVTQLKWRLLAGSGQALYEIGVSDSGQLIGLTRKDLDESLDTLERMAGELGATLIIQKEITLPASSYPSPLDLGLAGLDGGTPGSGPGLGLGLGLGAVKMPKLASPGRSPFMIEDAERNRKNSDVSPFSLTDTEGDAEGSGGAGSSSSEEVDADGDLGGGAGEMSPATRNIPSTSPLSPLSGPNSSKRRTSSATGIGSRPKVQHVRPNNAALAAAGAVGGGARGFGHMRAQSASPSLLAPPRSSPGLLSPLSASLGTQNSPSINSTPSGAGTDSQPAGLTTPIAVPMPIIRDYPYGFNAWGEARGPSRDRRASASDPLLRHASDSQVKKGIPSSLSNELASSSAPPSRAPPPRGDPFAFDGDSDVDDDAAFAFDLDISNFAIPASAPSPTPAIAIPVVATEIRTAKHERLHRQSKDGYAPAHAPSPSYPFLSTSTNASASISPSPSPSPTPSLNSNKNPKMLQPPAVDPAEKARLRRVRREGNRERRREEAEAEAEEMGVEIGHRGDSAGGGKWKGKGKGKSVKLGGGEKKKKGDGWLMAQDMGSVSSAATSDRDEGAVSPPVSSSETPSTPAPRLIAEALIVRKFTVEVEEPYLELDKIQL